ncbi:MAG: hypothetical protein JW729_00525 [Bacteroidales bacterium]|nr:hypothetical protein [Bacteroidales bacterium]
MKKLFTGIATLSFVFVLAFSANVIASSNKDDDPKTKVEKVEKKKECKTTCDKTQKKECVKKEEAKKGCCKKSSEVKK